MWYEVENCSMTKPADIDKVSSGQYVYVRKNFEEVPESGEGEQVISAHWKWMEIKIPKADWELYEQVIGHGEALDDVYAALTELAEMIVGEE